MNTSPDTEPNNQPGSDGHVSSAKAMALRWHNEPAGDFARRLGVSAKTIVRWSSTERRIRLDTADRIAEAINSHPLLIWGTEYANAVSATDPTEILKQINNLSATNAAKRCGVTTATVQRWRTHRTGTPASLQTARNHLAHYSHTQTPVSGRKCCTDGQDQ